MARVIARTGEREVRGAKSAFTLLQCCAYQLSGSSLGRSMLPWDRRRRGDGEILVFVYLCHCGCLAKNGRSIPDILRGTARLELDGSACQFAVDVVAMRHLGLDPQMARHM